MGGNLKQKETRGRKQKKIKGRERLMCDSDTRGRQNASYPQNVLT